MSVTLDVTFKEITLRTTDVAHDSYAMSISASVRNDKIGEFVYPLSTQNLEKIYKVFDGKVFPRPIVRTGQHFIDMKRKELVEYKNAKSRVRDIMKLERYPLEPNGKFVPYAHQTKIVASLTEDPMLFVGADCGTGKTGSLLRAIEILLNRGEIVRGKVLISAPLSILETSWLDDAKKFTDLKCKILWAPMGNKTIRIGDLKQIGSNDTEEMPLGALTKKRKKGMRFVRSDGYMLQPKTKNLSPIHKADAEILGLKWDKMECTWMEAYMPDGTIIPYGPIYGQSVIKETTRKNFIQECLLDTNVDVFFINHDGVRIYEDVLKAHKFEWVAVDESTKIKSMASKVTKAHIDISWNCKRRTPMSGTPNPNGFLDLWAQYYFADRGLTLNPKLNDYRRDYFTPIKVGYFAGKDAVKWELRDKEARQALIDRVTSTSIFLKQRDCVDLPERTDMVRTIYMTEEQSKIYEQMEKDLVAEFVDVRTNTESVAEAVNTLSKAMKLRQMTSGFVGHTDGIAGIVETSSNPKLVELDGLIDEIGDNKIVIACQFKEEIYTLLDRYKHLGVAAIFGDEKPEDRTANIKRFQETDELKIMILQPQAAAHGITLTKAHYFVWVSLDYNFEYYYQTGKRIERIGQKNPMFVYHFLAKTASGYDTIDHDIMDVLRSKSQDRDILFDNSTDIVDIANTIKNKIIERVQDRE